MNLVIKVLVSMLAAMSFSAFAGEDLYQGELRNGGSKTGEEFQGELRNGGSKIQFTDTEPTESFWQELSVQLTEFSIRVPAPRIYLVRGQVGSEQAWNIEALEDDGIAEPNSIPRLFIKRDAWTKLSEDEKACSLKADVDQLTGEEAETVSQFAHKIEVIFE